VTHYVAIGIGYKPARLNTEGRAAMAVRKREWTTRKGIKKAAYVVDYYDKARKRHIETFEKKKDAGAREDEIGVGLKSPSGKMLSPMNLL
jgi:hypothetical protein